MTSWAQCNEIGEELSATFLTGIHSLQTDSSTLSCKKSKSEIIGNDDEFQTGPIPQENQQFIRNLFLENVNSWKHSSGSAIALVPTVGRWTPNCSHNLISESWQVIDQSRHPQWDTYICSGTLCQGSFFFGLDTLENSVPVWRLSDLCNHKDPVPSLWFRNLSHLLQGARSTCTPKWMKPFPAPYSWDKDIRHHRLVQHPPAARLVPTNRCATSCLGANPPTLKPDMPLQTLSADRLPCYLLSWALNILRRFCVAL